MPIEVIDLPNPTNPARPAATVLLVRDGEDGVEVLMIRRGTAMAFGGVWAFPGGRIDEGDIDETGDAVSAARRAAVREAMEEVALVIEESSLVLWSHWLPPDNPSPRFSTWFFVAPATAAHAVVGIDGLEVVDHRWFTPAGALEAHRAGEIDLVPPTMVTLVQLGRGGTVADAMSADEPTYYATRFAQLPDGTDVCLWAGDAGYESGDPEAPGPRHRLVLHADGWQYLGVG